MFPQSGALHLERHLRWGQMDSEQTFISWNNKQFVDSLPSILMLQMMYVKGGS